MAASRKLQARDMKAREIDRTLKKVTEGVEIFDDIWMKVHNAGNANQKEKYETDLKKEIKKLQRLRDQIKGWIASAEIKDKTTLTEYRKLIETQMERFKVVERETKTKAYSKEGLGAAQRFDPARKEKEEAKTWLRGAIAKINNQINDLELEMDSLVSSCGKKKKADKDKLDKVESFKTTIERHKFHIDKLDNVIRMLDSNKIDAWRAMKLKDDVEYYIECCQETDFAENVFLYDELEAIDEAEGSMENELSSPAGTSGLSSPVAPSPGPQNHVGDNGHSGEERKQQKGVRQPTPVTINSISKDQQQPIIKPTATRAHLAHNNGQVSVHPLGRTRVGGVGIGQQPVSLAHSAASILADIKRESSAGPSGGGSKPITNHNHHHHSAGASASSTRTPTPARAVTPASRRTPTPQMVNGPTFGDSSGKKSAASIATTTATIHGTDFSPQQQQQNCLDTTTVGSSTKLLENNREGELCEANISPWLGVTPLGSIPLSPEHQRQFELMKAAHDFLPHTSDTEKVRPYLPRNPCPVPAHFLNLGYASNINRIQGPHQFDTPEFMNRVPTEVLFFIFYYMEGTKAQYLAAKALKKQSWRFHTKYMMWFQRHEEPKSINEEYEQGTYVYFDYERWSQRKKEGFTFEYRYLEDKEL